MRPSNHSHVERHAATACILAVLRDIGVCHSPYLRSVIGWNKDDTHDLLRAMVATGIIVRGDTCQPRISYALPCNEQLLPKTKTKAKPVERQTWASPVLEIAT